MALKHVNAVVVGAGAGGGIVAKELSQAGLSVILLERGRWHTYADIDSDELRSQRTPALGNAYGPDDERYRRVVRDAAGKWQVVVPSEWQYNNNAACVGGGTLSYGAMGWRFMPEDFRMRSTYGDVPGSTLEDWPIAYEDLEPSAKGRINGVSGDDHESFSPRRGRRHAAVAYSREGILLPSRSALSRHPFVPGPCYRIVRSTRRTARRAR
jgi:choline dehydrogenase-like flavoprotein